jgi:hypothetical protein
MAVPAALAGAYTNSGPLTRRMNLGIEVRQPHPTDTVYRYKNWCAAAQGWREYEEGTWISSESDVPLNSQGLPAEVPGGMVTRAMVQAVWTEAGNGGRNQGTFPAGNYVFTYSGSADVLTVNGSGVTVNSSEEGRIEFSSDGSEDVYIEISGVVSSLADFVMEEAKYEGHWTAGNYWYPETLVELSGVKCLEFEAYNICPGWPQTATPFPTWAQRQPVAWFGYRHNPVFGHADRNTAGSDFRIMPYELQVDLVNKIGCNYWITIPYWADQSFVESLAAYVHANLHARATVYIEYCGEPFFDGSLATPVNYCSEYLYDLGVAEGDPNTQADRYCIRAEERFTWFKGQCTGRTVKAALISGTGDTWSGFRASWISDLTANVSAEVVTPDLWTSSIYPGGKITPASGGMSKTWAGWLTATVDDMNNALNAEVVAKVAGLATIATTIASTGLPLGLYEFGMACRVGDFWGGYEEEADTIGDLIRAATASEDEYWRMLYMLNAVHSICTELAVLYCTGTARHNEVPWGLISASGGIRRYSSSSSPWSTEEPRYYAFKRFLTGAALDSGLASGNLQRVRQTGRR